MGVIDETGWPAPFFSPEDCNAMFGDELDGKVTWRESSDLSRFAGKTVRFKFELKDADNYALRVGK